MTRKVWVFANWRRLTCPDCSLNSCLIELDRDSDSQEVGCTRGPATAFDHLSTDRPYPRRTVEIHASDNVIIRRGVGDIVVAEIRRRDSGSDGLIEAAARGGALHVVAVGAGRRIPGERHGR